MLSPVVIENHIAKPAKHENVKQMHLLMMRCSTRTTKWKHETNWKKVTALVKITRNFWFASPLSPRARGCGYTYIGSCEVLFSGGGGWVNKLPNNAYGQNPPTHHWARQQWPNIIKVSMVKTVSLMFGFVVKTQIQKNWGRSKKNT